MSLRLVGLISYAVFCLQNDVTALLKAKAAGCHNDKSKASGFSMASFDSIRQGGKKHGVAIIGGHPDRSPLLRMVRGELSPRMPIGGELTAAEEKLIEDWIRQLPEDRATAKQAWTWPYTRPAKSAGPGGQNAARAPHEVDRLLPARPANTGLQPPKEADQPTTA